MATKKKSAMGFVVSLVFLGLIFGMGFYTGRNTEEVTRTAKRVVPPFFKKVETTVKGLFGIEEEEPRVRSAEVYRREK